MKISIKLVVILFLSLLSNKGISQTLVVQTFGNPKSKPIIFLHGGPGYNSVVFEETTGVELAKNNFFVISFDRRGEGRNKELKANYTFKQTFDDLNEIYIKYKLKKATLIGHSFGGVIATLFTDKHPNKVSNLILLGTPVSMQESLAHILQTSKEIYKKKADKVNLNYINMLEEMDKTSLEYCSYNLIHAMSNGFYRTTNPNKKAIYIYKTFKTNSKIKKYATDMNYLASQKFWENEKYTTISIKENIKHLIKNKVSVMAMYGKEDGLYSKSQINELRNLLPENSLKYLNNCSHNIFIDQQEKFIELLKKWI